MLVMRRRTGDRVLIGPEIEIEVLEISPTRVKLGIIAPETLAVMRKEVVLTRAENVTASRCPDTQTITWLSKRLSMFPRAPRIR